MSRTYTEKTKEYLTFQLTQEEIANKAVEAATLNGQVFQLNAEFSAYKKRRKSEIDTVASQVDQLLRVVNAKQEDREVECDKIYDFDRSIVSYVFKGEVMKERSMEQFEKQLQNTVPIDKTVNTTQATV
jgi:hypothetical protein